MSHLLYSDFKCFLLSLPQLSDDFALDELAGDFVAPTAASTVKASACVPSQSAPQVNTQVQLKLLSAGLCNPLYSGHKQTIVSLCSCIQLEAEADNALDALSDTLKDITPVPQPAPVPAKDLVKVVCFKPAWRKHFKFTNGPKNRSASHINYPGMFDCCRRKRLLKKS